MQAQAGAEASLHPDDLLPSRPQPAKQAPPPDTIAPTVQFSDNLSGVANRSVQSYAYSLTFSEAVTGLDFADLTAINAAVIGVTGSGANWQVTVIPTANVTGGNITLSLRAGAASDLAGNVNAAASNNSQTIDTWAPYGPRLTPTGALAWLVNPQVSFSTTLGNVVLELDPARAPITVANMLAYVDQGFYNGTLFHRVVPGFVAQGGGFTSGLAPRAPIYSPITLESNNGLSNLQWTVAMARTSAADSATSQFYVNLVNNTFLDYASAGSPGYAVFGRVVSGTSVVSQMTTVPTQTVGGYQNVPQTEIVTNGASVSRAGSSATAAGTWRLDGLEAGSSWQYSSDWGATWLAGSGSTLSLAEGNYLANQVLVRQLDAAGNPNALNSRLDFAVLVDRTAPVMALPSPVDDARGVAVDAHLSLNFSEAIARGTGTILLRAIDGGATIESFNAASSSRISISGQTLTIDPTAALAHGRGYYLDIAQGALTDALGNRAAASTTYNFTTSLVNPADPKSGWYEITQKIYVAYFGRPADTGGLALASEMLMNANAPKDTYGFVLAYGSNAVVTAILDNFGTSPESRALYAGADNRSMVTSVYNFMLGRAPDADGLDFWVRGIDSGVLNLAKAALNIMAGAEGYPEADGLTVAKKIVVAHNFTTALDTPAESSSYAGDLPAARVRAMLGGVSKTTDTGAYQATVQFTIDALPSTTSTGIHEEQGSAALGASLGLASLVGVGEFAAQDGSA